MTAVKVCGCGEPIVNNAPGGEPACWLHTDGRDGCINHLTREPTGAMAAPRVESRVDGDLLARNLRAARLRGRGGRR